VPSERASNALVTWSSQHQLVDKNPGKLHGLATVNAFTGDAGAEELTRAVRELKLRHRDEDVSVDQQTSRQRAMS